MKTKNVKIWVIAIAAMLVLLGPLAGQSRGDFVLTDDQWLTVNSFHYQGTLYDRSGAFIVPDGWVYILDARNSSSVDISGGTVNYLYARNSSTVSISTGNVADSLYAYNSSTVSVSGGTVGGLSAHDSSAVDISGGYVRALFASDYSSVDISGGSISSLNAYNSTVDISGGSISSLNASFSSAVDISGGAISKLQAIDSSVFTFYGRNFSVSGGLILYGDRVLGTGVLSGEWMDGTPWVVTVQAHYPTATILAIPEPATLLLLGLGAVVLRKKR